MKNTSANDAERFVEFQVQIDQQLYQAAQASLASIGCTVEQFAALCMLKIAHYTQEMSSPPDITASELIPRVVDDAIEILELLHANRAMSSRS